MYNTILTGVKRYYMILKDIKAIIPFFKSGDNRLNRQRHDCNNFDLTTHPVNSSVSLRVFSDRMRRRQNDGVSIV